MTQCDKILAHMRTYGNISHAEAQARYGICRLAARISDLRSRGYNIRSKMVAGKNRVGETVHFSLYHLEEQNSGT